MKRLISLLCLCGLLVNSAHADSCLKHRWYHAATVKEHWALLAHKLEPDRYQTVTAPDRVAKAAVLLEMEPAKEIPAALAENLTMVTLSKNPSENYFLVQGLGYSAPGGRLHVYALDDSVMVGYSYLGPLEQLPVIEIPVVLALTRLPKHVYTGCSGAS